MFSEYVLDVKMERMILCYLLLGRILPWFQILPLLIVGTIMACNHLTTFLSGAKYNITLHFIVHKGGTHEPNLNWKERRKRGGKKAHVILTVYRIISKQAGNRSVISENHKKQSCCWNKQIKRLCFQEAQQRSNTEFENTPYFKKMSSAVASVSQSSNADAY